MDGETSSILLVLLVVLSILLACIACIAGCCQAMTQNTDIEQGLGNGDKNVPRSMPPMFDPFQLQVPSAAALVVKAMKEPGLEWKKTMNVKANIGLKDVIEIAKVMRGTYMAKDLRGAVKEILETCVSLGCTVDKRDPKDLQQQISNGDFQIPLDWI